MRPVTKQICLVADTEITESLCYHGYAKNVDEGAADDFGTESYD